MKSESARRYIADIEPKLKQMYGQTILDYHVGWVGLFGQEIVLDVWTPEIVVKVKWQKTSGTADEKLAFDIWQINECYQQPAILVLGGTGFRQGAINFAKQHSGEGNLESAFTAPEFLRWLGGTVE